MTLRPLPLLLLPLLLAGCVGAPSLERDLSATLVSSPDELVLASLDSVDGDEFLVVCPYESASGVVNRLGFDWSGAPDYSESDDRQTLAIIRDGAVVSSAELRRGEIDFCASGGWRILSTSVALPVDSSVDPVRVSPPG